MAEIELEIKSNKLTIKVPLTSKGKFRCKNRKKSTEFGKVFAPKKTNFTEESYVEWQIGYDVKITDISKKRTSLQKYDFTGANGSKKYLYELSEIIWKLCKLNLITKKEISDLYKEVNNYSMFLQKNFQIKMIEDSYEIINNKKAKKSDIKLPTFTFDDDIKDELYTEISISKQQYAAGVQPMLYVIIPLQAFDNANKILGNNSSSIPQGIYTVSTKEKAKNFLKIMSYFGLCSENHQHDVLEILKIIKEHAF